MAGGTGRATVVPGFPGIGRCIEGPIVALGVVNMAVFGVLENLDIGVVRSQVTGRTGVWVACLGDGKLMTAVTGGAATGLTVPSSNFISPRCRFSLFSWFQQSSLLSGPRFHWHCWADGSPGDTGFRGFFQVIRIKGGSIRAVSARGCYAIMEA